MVDSPRKRVPDPLARDWPGPVVYLDYCDWKGFRGSDSIVAHAPEKVVFERSGTLFIVE